MGPIPRFPTWDALNVWLTEQCRKRQADVLRGHSDSIGQRLGRDLEAMMNLPYAYYEQLNGYEHLKTLDIGYFLYTGSYADDILAVLKPSEKTILHIPSVDARESTGDKHKEVGHIIDALGK